MPSAPSPPRILRVALPLPLPRLFDYLEPEDGARAGIGARVRVPFGPGERVGVVAAVAPASSCDPNGLKPALAVLDEAPLFAGELLDSLDWLARYTRLYNR